MEYSQSGLALTKQFEGLRLAPYQDVAGKWTIGYGHLIRPGEAFSTITEAEASALLEADVQSAVACVNDCVTVPLSQNQFDALVDFTFNLGCAALKGSTLLKLVNQEQFTAVPNQFKRWVCAGGRVVQGLMARRSAEAALFEQV